MPHRGRRVDGQSRGRFGPDARRGYEHVGVVREKAQFVQHLFAGRAEEVEGGGGGDRGVVVGVLYYVGRGGDAIEEGFGVEGEARCV